MKRPSIIIAISICAMIIVLASNCKKPPVIKPKDPVTIYNYLGDVKDYCVFKLGTYWVYENDLTHDIDSHWVSSCNVYEVTQKGTEDHSKHITLKQELFDMIVKTNFVDGVGNKCYWQYYTTGTSVNAYPEPKPVFWITCRKVWKSNGTYNDIFLKPYTSDKSAIVCQKEFYEKYTLNTASYDSVRVMRIGNDGVFPESKTPTGCGGVSDYYFAKGVGIIKMYSETYRMFDGKPWFQTWSLIRKKIIQ